MKAFKKIRLCKIMVVCVAMFFVMVIPFTNYTNIAAEESTTTPVTLEGSVLYANGQSIVIEKKADGLIHVCDPDGNELLENGLSSLSKVYGGSHNETINENVNITIHNVYIGTIYGGGYSDGTAPANVNGNVNIVIDGSINISSVYGGGYAEDIKGDAVASVNGNINLSIQAVPTNYHNSLQGGGYANANHGYSATAQTTGSITLNAIGRINGIRGGGYAYAKNGTANASVNGNIQITNTNADTRDIYAGGYANGSNATATANATSVIINDSEIASIYAGGTADQGIADVINTSIQLNNAKMYAYVFGGGYATNAGSAKVDQANITIVNSDIYAYVQSISPNVVAGTLYAGGNADATGHAEVNNVSITMENNTTAGTVYCGGNGSAKTGNVNLNYRKNDGSLFNGTTYYASLMGSGDQENGVVNTQQTTIFIEDSKLEHIWGGLDSDGNPSTSSQIAELTLKGTIEVKTITSFDTITLNNAIHLQAVLGKDASRPTYLKSTAPSKTPLIYCDDTDQVEDVYTMANGKLKYEVLDNKSVWSIDYYTYNITTQANEGGTITSSSTVNEGDDITISWKADRDYVVDQVLLDNVAISSDLTSYKLSNVSSDHVIQVIFKKTPKKVDPEIIIQKTDDLPNVEMKLDSSAANQLLTTEDEQALANGSSISFALDIKKVETVDEAVQQQIVKTLSKNQKLALQLDISFLKIKDSDITLLSETNVPLKITLQIPKEYVKENRAFYIVRTHTDSNGIMHNDILKDIDDNDETITFESDRFSVYSLIYEEVQSVGVDTSDESNQNAYFTMILLSFGAICITIKKQQNKAS